MNTIKESNLNEAIPPDVIHSLNNMIMEGAPASIVEVLSQRVEELTQVICTEWVAKGEMRANIAVLQERTEERIREGRSAQGEVKAREREMVRKGIDRLERQILQYVNVYFSKDVVEIALIKKCVKLRIFLHRMQLQVIFRKLL